jgi:hypothetical protein
MSCPYHTAIGTSLPPNLPPLSPPPSRLNRGLIENSNKTGVRLWTHCPFDKHGKIRRGYPLDAIANRSDRCARSDQRGRSVRAAACGRAQTARDAFDLQNHGGDVCRALQHLTGPPIESAAGFEDRLDPASMMAATDRHVEAHDVRPWRVGLLAQRDGPRANGHHRFSGH